MADEDKKKVNRVELLQTAAAMSAIAGREFVWKEAQSKTVEELQALIEELDPEVQIALLSKQQQPATPAVVVPVGTIPQVVEEDVEEPLIILSRVKYSHEALAVIGDSRDFEFGSKIMHLEYPSIKLAFEATLAFCWHSKISGNFNPTELAARFPDPENPGMVLTGRQGILKLVKKWVARRNRETPGAYEVISLERFEALKNQGLNAKMLEELHKEAIANPDAPGYKEFLENARKLHAGLGLATQTTIQSGPMTAGGN